MSAGYGSLPPVLSRREMLALSLAACGATICVPAFAIEPARAPPKSAMLPRNGLARVGPLGPPDAHGVRLPAGFSARIVARTGERPVSHRDFLWHGEPDGGAVFAARDGGWIYVSNAELANKRGGASALRFDSRAGLVDAYPILRNTNLNCAGGATPWGTWLSCEEFPAGLVWECDPYGVSEARAWPALGAFTHEAVAVDPQTLRLYLTEDTPDGCWYRFTPSVLGETRRPDLSRGTLEAAELLGAREGTVRWHRVADALGKPLPTRHQVKQATRFRGGEGCYFANGAVYFTTKHDNRVWAYDIAREHLRILYDASELRDPVLTGVDNVTVARSGDVLVAEDDGDMQIVAISADGAATPIVQIEGHRSSEIAGPAFDPSGTRLYFSSQRGEDGRNGAGVTYEVSGPFNAEPDSAETG